jgi:hypothetical protein
MRPACTAGWLKDYHYLEPTVLKVIVGNLLLILHNPDVGNQDGTDHRPFSCVIARETGWFFALQVKIALYAIEPTIFGRQAFLDYHCMGLVTQAPHSFELQVYAAYMGCALAEETWTASIARSDQHQNQKVDGSCHETNRCEPCFRLPLAEWRSTRALP